MSHIDWDAHRNANLAEDIAFLREAGASDEEIARRLGANFDTLARRDQRARAREDS